MGTYMYNQQTCNKFYQHVLPTSNKTLIMSLGCSCCQFSLLVHTQWYNGGLVLSKMYPMHEPKLTTREQSYVCGDYINKNLNKGILEFWMDFTMRKLRMRKIDCFPVQF